MFHLLHYSPLGDGIISGHADGKIVRYMFQDEHSRVSDRQHQAHPGIVNIFKKTNMGRLIFLYILKILGLFRR